MKPLELKINRSVAGQLLSRRPLALAVGEAAEPTPAARTAEKLVTSCRENVCFLNRHLKHHESDLDLPPEADNVLYLAYTVGVHEDAPFSVLTLRRHLAQHGIETGDGFRFALSGVDYRQELHERLRPQPKIPQTFCLPCHAGLTILDLQQIITAFDDFFACQPKEEDSGGFRKTT